MISFQARVLSQILCLSNLKRLIDKTIDSGGQGLDSGSKPPAKMHASFQIEMSQSYGRKVYTLGTKMDQKIKHIFYLHGGAYVYGFSRFHWGLIAKLIRSTGCTIIAPDYPLAPNYTYLDSFKMVEPIYKELVAKVGGDNVILMGDSAGGGFALALAQKMKAEGTEGAKQIILLSPWLDIALENEEIPALESKDPILGVSSLKRAARLYAGSDSLSNYLLSPINGPLDGLGEISIFTGTKDLLWPDAKKFKSIAEEKGISIKYFEYEEMLHAWVLFNLPESKIAIEQIAGLINSE